MSNNAKECYDQIAHMVVNLALQRLGIPKPTLQSMLETIQEMKHHIRTAFGDSEGCMVRIRENLHRKAYYKEVDQVQLDGH
jgi:hypothetical protein